MQTKQQIGLLLKQLYLLEKKNKKKKKKGF